MSEYCTHIKINDKARLDLFTPSCFRVRYSELDGEKFPEKKYLLRSEKLRTGTACPTKRKTRAA